MKKALVAFVAVLALVVGADVSGFGKSGLEAATPLPSGCYTDSSGLPVCGPNYQPSINPSNLPSPVVSSTPCSASPGVSGTTILVPAGCQPSPVPSPQVTSTPCSAAPGVLGAVIEIPAGCSSSSTPAPNVMIRGGSAIWDTVALAETSATHVYPMNDAAPCNTIADAISSGATALPSPVPLPTATGTPHITCGAPPLGFDGETSVYFPGNASAWIQIPSTVVPSSGTYSIEVVAKTSVATGSTSAGAAQQTLGIMSLSASGTPFHIGRFQSGSSPYVYTDSIALNSTNISYIDNIPGNQTTDIIFTWDGTTASFYVNGDLVYSANSTPSFGGQLGSLGYNLGASQIFAGRIAKFAVYNTALSQAKVWAHVAALGL